MIVKKGAGLIVLATYSSQLKSIRRQVRDDATAENIIQTACAAVLGDPEFDPTRPDAAGFIKRKAWWLIQDHWRGRGQAAGLLPDSLADTRTIRPDRVIERAETSAWVWSRVAQLPKDLRAVMTLHLEGLDHNQIAADHDLPIRIVYGRFHRAKVALHRILEQ